MTVTTRNVSPGSWHESAKCNGVTSERMGEVVDGCMASLQIPRVGSPVTGYGPWPRPEEACYGIMWAGVVKWKDWQADESGGCLLAKGKGDRTTYIRLSPAPPSAEVQFGFCYLRLEKSEEFVRREFGERELSVKALDVSTTRAASFRIDKVINVILALCDGRDTTAEALRFRLLLGNTPLCDYIGDVTRSCYLDTSSGRDIMHGRSDIYREMAEIVALQLWPRLFRLGLTSSSPSPLPSTTLGLPSYWNRELLQPHVFNVVMPEPIFTATLENLKKGIPPVVPQYATGGNFMFNGPLGGPCTGNLTGVSRLSGLSRKLLAGVLNASNSDLLGGTSFWRGSHNPPQGWIDEFTGVVRRLGHMTTPFNVGECIDLALMEARKIPVMMVLNPGDAEVPLRKFARLVGTDPCVTRECNCTGLEWLDSSCSGNETEVSSSPLLDLRFEATGTGSEEEEGEDEHRCVGCGYTTPNEMDLIMCSSCGFMHCLDCVARCGDCGDYFCETCNEAGRDHCRENDNGS